MNDIGYLGNTQHARDILEGTYTYPPNTDKRTMKILVEAHMLYLRLRSKSIETQSLFLITKTTDKVQMKQYPHHTAISTLDTIRLQVLIGIYPPCTLPSYQHVPKKGFPLLDEASASPSFWRKLKGTIIYTRCGPLCCWKATSTIIWNLSLLTEWWYRRKTKGKSLSSALPRKAAVVSMPLWQR